MSFVLLMASSAWWSFCYALYGASADLQGRLLWAKALQIGAIVVPLAWTWFVLQYTGRRSWLTATRMALLAAVPAATLVLMLTNEMHGWFWPQFDLTVRNGRVAVNTTYGPAFLLHVGYSWALLSVSVVLLVVSVLRSPHLYRLQAESLLVAVAVPWIGNVLHISAIVRFPANPMPFLFTLSGGIFFWAIFRLRLLDILPVAREAVVDEMPDALVVLDHGDRILDLNPAARTLLGVDARGAIGRTAGEVSPNLAQLLSDPSANGGDGGSAEFSVEGATRICDVRITPVTDGHGHPVGRCVVLRDITSTRLTATALALQTLYLEQLFEAAPEAIALLDEAERVLRINGEFTRMFGYRPDEVEHRHINELIVPDDMRSQGGTLTLSASAGARSGAETVRRRKDGSLIEVSVGGTPVFADGRQIAIYGIYRDITARRMRERERTQLLEREQRARASAEAASRRAAFLADVGTLLATSFDRGTSYGELARLAVGELADYCLIDEVLPDGGTRRVAVAHRDPSQEHLLLADDRNPADADPRQRPVLQVIRTGEPLLVSSFDPSVRDRIAYDPRLQERMELLGLRSFIIAPLVARHRTLGAITLGLSDPARRYGPEDLSVAIEMARRAALALDNARLYEEAQRSAQARQDVLAVVSHDLRNPLAGVVLNASTLLDTIPEDVLSPWQRDNLRWILLSAERMDRLIEDLLDVTRIEAGQLPVDPAPCVVSTLLREAVEMLTPVAGERSIRLEREEVEGDLRIHADPVRVYQVLSNLVGNAVKFSPPDGVVRLGAEAQENWVHFWVRDQGRGIPAEHLPRLFDRFWQGDGRTRRNGAGLGLQIVRGIVEAHGGTVWVESTAAEGSTFHFTLPQSQDSEAVPARPGGA